MADQILVIGIKAIAGAVGASAISFFWVPEKLQGYSRFNAGVLTGACGAFASVFLVNSIVTYLGFDATNIDNAMAASFVIGMLSVGVVGAIAKFFSKREDKDIAEIVQDLKP